MGRLLSQSEYGTFSVYLSYINIISLFFVLGLDRALIKEVSVKVLEKKSPINYLKLASLVISIEALSLVFLLVLNNYLKFFDFPYLLILVILILQKILFSILDGYLQGLGLIVKSTLATFLFSYTLKLLFFIVFYYTVSTSLISALYAFLVADFFSIFMRAFFIRRWHTNRNNLEVINNLNSIKFLRYSILISFSAIIVIILQNIDKVMISILISDVAVAKYRVGQNFMVMLSIFITPFMAFWPKISQLYKQGLLQQIEYYMSHIVKYLTYLVIPLYFFFILNGTTLLSVYGVDYSDQVTYYSFIILSTGIVIDTISGPIGAVLIMTKYAKNVLYNNIISLIVNIILNILLYTQFGIVGVAISTAISTILNNSLAIYQSKKYLGVFSYNAKYFYMLTLLIGFCSLVYFVLSRVTFISFIPLELALELIVFYTVCLFLFVKLEWDTMKKIYYYFKGENYV